MIISNRTHTHRTDPPQADHFHTAGTHCYFHRGTQDHLNHKGDMARLIVQAHRKEWHVKVLEGNHIQMYLVHYHRAWMKGQEVMDHAPKSKDRHYDMKEAREAQVIHGRGHNLVDSTR